MRFFPEESTLSATSLAGYTSDRIPTERGRHAAERDAGPYQYYHWLARGYDRAV